MRFSSGETAAGTNGAGWTTVPLQDGAGNPPSGFCTTMTIINESAVAGFWRLGAGGVANRLPAGPCSFTVHVDYPLHSFPAPESIQIKRATDTDLSGVFISLW